MNTVISCPRCQTKVRLPTDQVGHETRCPACGHIRIASAEEPAVKSPQLSVNSSTARSAAGQFGKSILSFVRTHPIWAGIGGIVCLILIVGIIIILATFAAAHPAWASLGIVAVAAGILFGIGVINQKVVTWGNHHPGLTCFVVLISFGIVYAIISPSRVPSGPPSSRPPDKVAEENPVPEEKPIPKDINVRIVIYNDTKTNPVHDRASLWFQGYGSWWFKDDLELGSVARNLGRRPVGEMNVGEKAIAFYPDDYEVGPELLIPFKMTEQMNPEPNDQDHIDIEIRDDEISILGLPIQAAIGKTEMKIKRAIGHPNETKRPLNSYAKTFGKLIRLRGDPDGSTVIAVAEGNNDHQVVVTVSNQWHLVPYEVRLQTAHSIWTLWAGIRSDGNRDLAQISFVDGTGNEVGGSGAQGLWVQKE